MIDFEIKVGGRYFLRNGQTAEILHNDNVGEYPFVALLDCGTKRSYTPLGRWFTEDDSEFDIMPPPAPTGMRWVSFEKRKPLEDGKYFWKKDGLKGCNYFEVELNRFLDASYAQFTKDTKGLYWLDESDPIFEDYETETT